MHKILLYLFSFLLVVKSSFSAEDEGELVAVSLMKKLSIADINSVLYKTLSTLDTRREICQASLLHQELDMKVMLYRHGDRPPMSFYPKDPYQDPSLWGAPLGELTNIGKMQHFKLGKWLRKRYNGFLSQIYKKEEIFIRSSNNDRCLMSASANLAGLYPPTDEDVWNVNLSWQPIPIHTLPEKEDDIVEVPDSCPIYNNLKEKAQKEVPYFSQINKKYHEFFAYLSEKTGSEISNVVEASYIYNTLTTEISHNFTLPTWALEVYPLLKELGDIAPKLFTATPQLTRLFVGRYFHNVLEQFNSLSGGNVQEARKLKLFSGHDDQVYSILSALQVEELEAAPYASVVILELRKSAEGELFVQLLYKAREHVADIRIPSCDEQCSFKDFVKIVQSIALSKEEFNLECEFEQF